MTDERVTALVQLVSEFGQCRWSEGVSGASYLDRAGERAKREEAADLYKEIEAAARALLAQAAQPQPVGYVTAIEEGRVLMLPRYSLNTDGLVPLFATPPEDKGSQDR